MTPSRARRAAARLRVEPSFHLPSPPTDDEKFNYLGTQRRWPFVWLFLAQALLIAAFVAVMTHSPLTSVGLVLLSFMVPPAVVNLWLRIRTRRIHQGVHEDFVARWRMTPKPLPSVDVFIPTCGEDARVLQNTFDHVGRLEWAGELRVFVLDDADDAATRDLAVAAGFDYVVRSNRGEYKKAGNLIAAFDRTKGDFIAVFDADFAPRPDFLWETMPYMDDPRTGVVQTAQYFDVDRRVNEFGRAAGALQELFFRWIQPARDTYEAAIVAGTNLIYRRSAVVAAGGFAKVPLGEDVHSGVKLWVAEYRTRYLPLALAKGLAPDTWKALTNQQYRWCRSSMLLMISGFFRDAPFSWQQRLAFWAAFIYYMGSAATLITAGLPTLVMLWFYPQEIIPAYYLPVVPAVLAVFVVFPRLSRGWTLFTFRVTLINACCHFLAVIDALRAKVQAWVPTGAADARPRAGGVPRRAAVVLRVWFVLSQGLLWGGVAMFIVGGHDPWMIWPIYVLGAYQVVLMGPAAWRLGPAPQRAHHRRSKIAEPVGAEASFGVAA